MEITVDRSIRHWWVFLVRGILFILTGIYMISSPATSYVALGFFFGLVILLAGIAELLHAYQDRRESNRSWHLVIGLIDILLGLILMSHISASVTVLRIIVGIWFLFRGISLLSFSGILGRSWILSLGGVLTILFGLLVLFNPVFGSMTIILWIAFAFILTGIFNILLAFRLKRFYR
ncbi:MAG: protein of unknown function rane [Mucilaginibacter sp.]|nr:protein of unknown function rane [Mucilaginibacter sp.]